MEHNKFFSIGLPKWPQMLVTGKSVSVQQAKDIILRTDDFLTDSFEYAGGNQIEFNERYRKASGLVGLNYEDVVTLRKKLGFVFTDYVHNIWSSSCFIYGPHGWCHPNGDILYVDNIGKWPDAENILSDWEKIANAFKYLDLNVTIMSGEQCEKDTSPVFNIRVYEGKAHMAPPNISVHDEETLQKIDRSDSALLEYFGGSLGSRELGLPVKWYDEYAHTVRSALIELNCITR